MWINQNDYALSGIGENLRTERFYNSQTQQSGMFGFGWQSDYDESILNFNNLYLRLMSGNGRGFYFAHIGDNVYVSASADYYAKVIRATDNTYTLTLKGRADS